MKTTKTMKTRQPNHPRLGRISATAAVIMMAATVAHANPGRSMNSTTGEGITVGADYSTLKRLEYAGQITRYISDGRGNNWNYYFDEVWLFNAVWEDGHTTEFRMNSDFTYTEAAAHAELLATAVGRLPKYGRHDFNFITINPGTGAGGGGGNGWSTCIDSTLYTLSDFGYSFEELGLHEAGHSDLSTDNFTQPGWLAAQSADNNFISGYARNNVVREDFTESLGAWNSIRHRPERCSQDWIDFVESRIPNRLVYLDSLDLDPYPLNRPVATEYVDNTSSLIVYQPAPSDWSSNFNRGSYTNSLNTTTKAGATASFNFTGVQATFYGMLRDDMGIADIYIDGEYAASVDCYSSETKYFQPLYTTPRLTGGNHTVTVARSGAYNPAATSTTGRINVDAFTYEPMGGTNPPARPGAVTAVAGMDSIRLNWPDNTDFDLDSYNLYRSDSSGSRTLVGPCLKQSYFVDEDLPNNGTFNYEVTALDTRGNESTARAISATVSGVPVLVDDRASSVSYTGVWGNWSGPEHYSSTTSYSTTVGSTATFSFNGRQARVYGTTRDDRGKADIFVDGTYVTTVDCYTSVANYRQVIYETPVLPAGNHTLAVRVTGTYNPAATATDGEIVIDAFDCIAVAPFRSEAITPYLRVDGGNWRQIGTVNVTVGSRIDFGPWPYWGTGVWSWTGPKRFRAEDRAMSLTNIQLDQAGTYVANYIDGNGRAEGSFSFTVNVSDPYPPATPIIPYVKVNNDPWASVTAVAVNQGDNVVLGPQPNVQNGWSWTGPNGFSSTTKRVELDNIQPAAAGFYTATYTNSSGISSELSILVNVKDSSPGNNFFTQSYSGTRDNYRGFVGYEFTPSQDITVHALGRSVSGGFLKGNHEVRIWRVAANPSMVSSAIIRPNSPIDIKGYAYEQLSSPVTLSSGVTYRIASWERVNGDPWRDFGNISAHTEVAVIHKGVYGDGSYPTGTAWGSNHGYGPSTFYYEE